MTGDDQTQRRRPVAPRLLLMTLLTLAAGALFVVPIDLFPEVDTDALQFRIEMVIHIVVMAGVVLLWAVVFPELPLAALLGIGLVFATAAEASQLLPMVERSPRWVDYGFNLIGVALGLALVAAARVLSRPLLSS